MVQSERGSALESELSGDYDARELWVRRKKSASISDTVCYPTGPMKSGQGIDAAKHSQDSELKAEDRRLDRVYAELSLRNGTVERCESSNSLAHRPHGPYSF
jgi:hypothetical protein